MDKFEVLEKRKIGHRAYIFGCRNLRTGGKFIALVKTDDKGEIIRMATFGGDGIEGFKIKGMG